MSEAGDRGDGRPVVLLVYDRTAPRLGKIWAAGNLLYRARRSVDAGFGARSFAEALAWIEATRPGAPIAEIQFWGHGKWGDIRIGDERLDERALLAAAPHSAAMTRVRQRLAPGALLWLRTCETFGADRGQSFARALSERWACRVAGHTYVIDLWQSGLHALAPGETPDWSAAEGLAEGSPRAPKRARRSTPAEPRTISCFSGALPEWA
jgi:hypothetical protein